jgi:hypothetical protein
MSGPADAEVYARGSRWNCRQQHDAALEAFRVSSA